MKAFAELYLALDETNKTNVRLEALDLFFRTAPEQDRLWMLALFSGRRPRRIVAAGRLSLWAAEQAGIPAWLFEESYHITGDLAETVSLLLPLPDRPEERSLSTWITLLQSWRGLPEASLRAQLRLAWCVLPENERMPFHKLLTGGMRLGVSTNLVFRALAGVAGLDPAEIARRLTGSWHPEDLDWESLIAAESGDNRHQPFPFYLATSLEAGPEELPGAPSDWFAEWKWDGIRAQLLYRTGSVQLWSRGEDLITASFPEFALLAGRLPERTVLDGELVAFKDGKPMDFQELQARLGRKSASRSLIRRIPVLLMAYDLLEYEGEDWRQKPFRQRRADLEGIVAAANMPSLLRISPALACNDWAAAHEWRGKSRDQGSEGLMIKRMESPYGAGRRRGDWFKWKVDPYTVDAVLMYAQRGHGRRAGLYTDFTFGIWRGQELLPFTKAYSGLNDAEVRDVNNWIKLNTLERKGPVVILPPVHVFEIAFEGIARSSRHRSGIALRFPRIYRWRRDKPVQEADRLEELEKLLSQVARKAPQPGTGDLFKDLP